MATIDKRNALPYYEQLAELLRREIGAKQAAGELYPLPSENELAEQHGISRATVRHALDELEREGWIYRQKGVGSFAPVHRVEQDLTQLVSTTEAMRQRGWLLVTKVLSLEQVPAAPHVARALELPPARPCTRCAACAWWMIPRSASRPTILPAALCPKLEEADLTGSLYRLLESRYGLRLWTGREVLRARGATAARGQPARYPGGHARDVRRTHDLRGQRHPGRVSGGGVARRSV